MSIEDAKQRLEAWSRHNRQVRDEKISEASLSDILRRYWEHHAKKLPSAGGNRDALAKWLEYWKEASIADFDFRLSGRKRS